MKKLKRDVKEVYYQYVKPGIDKVLSDPGNSMLIGGALGVVGSYFYKPDFDARKAKTKDEAYKMARSTGAKTFIWNGKHYNTDYKGNPKKTLVQQKQEELDTYGITNEQTGNKNLIENRLLKNLNPYSYKNPIKRVLNTVILNKPESKNITDGYSNERQDLFNLTLHTPQKNNTVGISDYKPTINKQTETNDYYYKINSKEIFNDIDNSIKETKRLKNMSVKKLENSITEIKNDNRLSKVYKDNVLPRLEQAVELKTNKRSSENISAYTELLGGTTIGKKNNYLSYYDKWDINPFGAGNDKPIYELGKPLNIYDRKYFNK